MFHSRYLYSIFSKVLCQDDYKSLCESVQPSVFMLKSTEHASYCGGFFINNKGVGLSAYHFYTDIGKNMKKCTLLYNGKEYEVDLLYANEENHAIVIRAKGLYNNLFLKIVDAILDLGEEVVLFSVNPFGVCIFEPGFLLDLKYSNVSQINFGCFRSSCRGGPGFSGGPLVNRKGEVVAMHKSYSGLFSVFDSVSIPAANILSFLRVKGKFTENGWEL